MHTEIRAGEDAAALFGAGVERTAFERTARESIAAPQTAGVVVTAPSWVITLLFGC
jgi:hypothetical protein